jgi:hypothetical protein
MSHLGRTLAVLAIVAAGWLASVHRLLRPVAEAPRDGAPSPWAQELAAAQVALWTDPASRAYEVERMRKANAEWDFMGRTFLVLALANMALREPAEKVRYLEVVDRIIDETIALDRDNGVHFFLMPYSRSKPFLAQPPRSVFVDGEIALMLGARRLVGEHPQHRAWMARYTAQMLSQMQAGPVLSGESYPDECWTFCNTAALAALRIEDFLDGTDRSTFFADWVRTARAKLVEPKTGLLVSSFRHDGTWLDGPEGSSLWMSAHNLLTVDAEFARDQYRRARQEIGRTALGFGYAREWPVSYMGETDVDSGPIVPLLEASPGSSGLALLGASAFGDDGYFASLAAALELGAFPMRRAGSLRYTASNQVGDAVILYSAVQGPLWRKVAGSR